MKGGFGLFIFLFYWGGAIGIMISEHTLLSFAMLLPLGLLVSLVSLHYFITSNLRKERR